MRYSARSIFPATLLVGAVGAFMFTGAAHAMSFPDFDAMAAQDRQDYMTFLVDAAQKAFINQGQKDTAAKVYQLFHEVPPGASLSMGEAEFEGNLANERVIDAQRHAQAHNVERLQVEAALAVTLKKNGIQPTPDFMRGLMQIANTFKPKNPAGEKAK